MLRPRPRMARVISADGGVVAFRSRATDLVGGLVDGNGTGSDVFLYARGTGTTTLVSRTAALPVTTGDTSSDEPLVSADGGFVVFRSGATDLVAGLVDGNGFGSDVFLYDRVAGTTTLVSQALARGASRTVAAVVATGNGFSEAGVLSADGAVIAFRSEASNLTADDRNGLEDVFVWVKPCAERPGPRPCPGAASRALR